MFMLLAPSSVISFSAIPGALGMPRLWRSALTALATIIAWKMDSTQFPRDYEFVLIPMWCFRDPCFPLQARQLLKLVMSDPLTYGLAACAGRLRRIKSGSNEFAFIALSFGVSLLLRAFVFATAILVTRRTSS